MDSKTKAVLDAAVRHYTAQRAALSTGQYIDPATGLPADTHGDPAKQAGLAAAHAWFLDAEALVTALRNHEPVQHAIEFYNNYGGRALQIDDLIDYHNTLCGRYDADDISELMSPEAEFCEGVAAWHVEVVSCLGDFWSEASREQRPSV